MLCEKCKTKINTRTLAQNSALHKLFSELADVLNDSGFYMGTILEIETEWNPTMVKELLWRKVQKAVTCKDSTTKLNKSDEINLIYDHLNRALIERTGGVVSLPAWPSWDDPTSIEN